jgi:hypothetical protein
VSSLPERTAKEIALATGLSRVGTARGAARPQLAARADARLLRRFVVAAGLCWSILFVIVGLHAELQMFGDASMFSYAVAVRDAWAFHWHNIPDRLFSYLFSTAPAEAFVRLTKDPRGGIVVYGFLQFVPPLLGLAATWIADRSPRRVIFTAACLSTACLCPLVFGFPTEMWMAHSLFWPALAICHYARGGIVGSALVFSLLLALVFTHEGALIFALAILAALLLRGLWDAAFLRASAAFLAVLSIWLLVRLNCLPGDYYAPVIARAALTFIDPGNLTSDVFLLLFAALAGYAVAVFVLRGLTPRPYLYAATLVALVLSAYWLWLDHALHAVNRYNARTALLIATPLLGALASAYALAAEGRLRLAVPLLPRLMAALAHGVTPRAAAGAIALVMLVHAVETAKFVLAWNDYKTALRDLATGTVSDPVLGDAHFVSSARIGAALNRLSWFSTTQYLSVLVTPDFAPTRLVIDPHSTYFWLSCATATANERAKRAVPAETRRLVRLYACLHR